MNTDIVDLRQFYHSPLGRLAEASITASLRGLWPRLPDERLLAIYNALRPYRSTKKELLDIAAELEGTYGAKVSAGFVREAADVYEARGRLRVD